MKIDLFTQTPPHGHVPGAQRVPLGTLESAARAFNSSPEPTGA